MRRTAEVEGGRTVLAQVSPRARRAITPTTFLLAMQQLSRERTLCAQLADGDVVFHALDETERANPKT